MNAINFEQGHASDIKHPNQFFSTISWYRSLKCLAVLHQWKLLSGYNQMLSLLRTHQQWSDQHHYQHADHLLKQLVGLWPDIERQPRIWACVHIGPYAMIARTLMVMGYKLAVLLRADVFEEQEQIYRAHFHLSFGREPVENELIFIKANVGNPLLRLKEAIRNGCQVIFFMDGQLSLGEEGKGWASVRLHGSNVSLREGIVALSHWTGTPITAVVLTLLSGQIKLRLSKEFYVNSKAEYQNVLQQMIDLLHALEVEELIQWECLPIILDKGQGMVTHNNPDRKIWLPLHTGGNSMLFDIATGRSVSIPADEFDSVSKKFKGLLEGI